LFSTLSFLSGVGQSASASSLGSKFDGTDMSPVGDLAQGAVDIPDAVNPGDATNYGNGPGNTENSQCPPIGSGTASPKDDLSHFYFGSDANSSGVFAYAGWRRAASTGTTTIDFEFNQNTGAATLCNGVNPLRKIGDVLITYDFQGSGPFVIDVWSRIWNGTTWGTANLLNPAAYEASISADGLFGEMVVNLNTAGLLSTAGCFSFASVFPKTRSSSSSFTNSMKDFVAPLNVLVSNCGAVKIHKKDDAGAALSGVQFDLYTSVGGKPGVPVTPAQSCTTDANGDCTISGIQPGDYYLVEDAPPSGYDPAAPQPVTVTANTTVTLTFTDPRQPGAIKIIKHDDLGNSLDGAEFSLYFDGNPVAGKTCVTSGGTCTISNILPPGTYTVKETKVPTGYTGAADQTVTVQLGQTATLTFVDTRQPATVNVVKKDDAGALLAGAEFSLYTDNGGKPGSPVAGKTCTTSLPTGGCTIGNILPPGTYWVVETVTPTGYTTAAPQPVTLGLNQTVTLTFTDDRQPAAVTITKRDDNGALLAGAEFSLYTDNGGKPGSPVAGKTCTTTLPSGTCSITNILPPGTYWVVETKTPTGHTTAAPQQVVLALNQTVALDFTDPRQPATVIIIKKDDAGHLMAGAEFTLYTNNGGQPGSPVAGKTCTTTLPSGSCTIDQILPPGTYWLVETVTPKGYDTAAPQKAVLSLNETLTLTFRDPRQPATVNIVKVDDAGSPVGGAGFTLYTDNGGKPGSPVAGKTCTTTLPSGGCSIGAILPAGTYWVVETTTPPGYATAPPQQVVLHLGQTATLTFTDNRLPIGIALVKNVDGQHTTAASPLLVESGDTANYTVTITNTGQVPLTITALTDSLNSGFAATCPQGVGSTLNPGDHFTCTYSSTITALADNTAAVSGVDVLSRTVDASDEVVVKPINPAIALDKTGPAAAHVGDAVTYTFTVTNPGDVGLTNVVLTDSKCSTAPVLQSQTGGNTDTTLDPGETWTYTCPYTVAATDGTSVKNTANVAGTDPLNKQATATASWTFPVLHPAVAIDKTANPTSISGTAPVTFSYKVTNTGDTTLYNVVVTDDILGAIGTIAQLDPGQSVTLTKTVTMGPGSPTTNVGTATGTDSLGGKVSSSDPATIAIVLGEVITRPAPPTLPRTGAMIEREVRWALVLLGFGLVLMGLARRRRPLFND
jgi:uncharacterized repeat protein (TIGR01451 family)